MREHEGDEHPRECVQYVAEHLRLGTEPKDRAGSGRSNQRCAFPGSSPIDENDSPLCVYVAVP